MKRASSEFQADITEVAAARRFAIGRVEGWGLASDEVALVVSELATNAVKHARSPFTVSLSYDADRVFIEVSDLSSQVPELGRPLAGAVGGRGLLIVETLSNSWGVRFPGQSGKAVWAELDAR